MKYLNKLEEVIISMGMLITTLLVFANVALRLVGTGISWSEELIRYILILVTFLGSSVCIREGMHFSVDLLVESFKGPINDAFKVLINLVGIIFSILLTYYAIKFCQFSFSTSQMSPSLNIPMYFVYMIIPVSGALFVLRYVQQLIGIFTKDRLDNSSAKGDLI